MSSPKAILRYLSNLTQRTYYWIGVIALLLPNILLTFASDISLVGKSLNILFPLGLWMILLALGKRPGKTLIVPWGIMLLINCVQIVLLTLFKGAVISVDLLLSLFSASGDEAGELLGGLILPILVVLITHAIILFFAFSSWRQASTVSLSFRRKACTYGLLLTILSIPLAVWANRIEARHTIRGDIYPLNVFYNIYITTSKLSQLAHIEETSSSHSYQASSLRPKDEREIYVFVIGETSRAFSYQLYGYPRETNPKLSQRDTASLIVFHDVLTESNTTSKSVPILLSPADAENIQRLPNVKGIFSALREAGFHTVFISNQPENRSFLDHLAYEADEHYRIRDLRRKDRSLIDTRPIYDGDMLPFLDKILTEKHQKLFIVLHEYGEHWSYPDRYPTEFSHFKDDQPLGANPREKERLVNAYDNAIRYNDYFLDAVIQRLERIPDASTAMYYTSDHGEDIYDDQRERILHSSPTISYYQLHVPALLWMSDSYRTMHPDIARAAKDNKYKAATSRSNFHSLLSLAGIQTYERKDSLSLLSPRFHEGTRSYLNDRYECIPIKEMLTEHEDIVMWTKMKLRPLQ